MLKLPDKMKCERFFSISIVALVFISYSFSRPATSIYNEDPFIVVLDAGHGGYDPGNLGNGYFEKNIALNIVLKIGQILGSDPNFKVIYTRKDDTFVDLYVRGEIANKAKADLFVSVHCDSHTSNAHGAGTFVLGLHANKQNFEIAKKENSVIYLEDDYKDRYAGYDINSPESVIGLTIMQEEFLNQSIRLAKAIQDNFTIELKRNDRKVKQAGFIVLHQTFMPSVLVETGFLTNDKEGAYLNSKKGQAEMGEAIADAIITYKAQIKAGSALLEKPMASTPEPSEPFQTKVKEEVTASPFTRDSERELASIEKVAKPSPSITSGNDKKEFVVVEKPSVVKENDISPKIKSESQKKMVEQAEKNNSDSETKPENSKIVIDFKVQILASAKDIALRADNFKGLNKLSKEPYKTFYRYMYGSASSLKNAELLKSNAVLKGYSTAYIVAYKNGERITIKEALKYISE